MIIAPSPQPGFQPNSASTSQAPTTVPTPRRTVVVPSRLFARPDEFLPDLFKAYGILAFPARATPSDRARHMMICAAYKAVLPQAGETSAPASAQMVTVWPLTKVSDEVLFKINFDDNACELAVDNYGLVLSQIAIRHAKKTGMTFSGAGPYLLAWAPPGTKGLEEATILSLDLSDITGERQAKDIFRDWANDIEADPSLWRDGWKVETLRAVLRLWVDKYGEKLVSIITK